MVTKTGPCCSILACCALVAGFYGSVAKSWEAEQHASFMCNPSPQEGENMGRGSHRVHSPPARHPDTMRFVFLTSSQAGKRQLLECPNHAYGTMKDGMREMEKRLSNIQEGQLAFAQLCVLEQMASMKM